MHIDTQVLIIGAGPVGVLSALTLADAGIHSVVVERRLERLSAPKAHAVNPRTLEICERLEVPAASIRRAGAPREQGGQVRFVSTLTGAEFGALPYERQDDAVREFTPFPLTNIAQPLFETELGRALEKRDSVSMLRGCTCAALTQDDETVTAAVSARGSQAPIALTARYAIAADGAGSRTREQLGINLEGPEALQNYMMIHFEAELSSLTRDRPGVLYFCLHPQHSGVFIAYDQGRTWVFMQAYDTATQSLADFSEDACSEYIEQAVGQRISDLKICNVSPWAMSAQVATEYRRQRIFLAGDAAHRFPPTGGLGLNTGVGDAQNLCWKLAMVLNGQATEQLLQSYQAERQPVARINSHQSLTNSAKLLELHAALYGSDPLAKIARYQSICDAAENFPEVAAAIETQRPHFDSLNLQLGYRYGVDIPPERVAISDYQPSFEAGAYLPHVQLADDQWLLGMLPGNDFALLTGPDATAWAATGLPTFSEGRDFQTTAAPWWQQAGLAENGALLIRPDGHIGLRWHSPPVDPAADLGHYFLNTLGQAYESGH